MRKAFKAIFTIIAAIILSLNFTSCESGPSVHIDDMWIEEGDWIIDGYDETRFIGQSGKFDVRLNGNWTADFIPNYTWESSDDSVIEVDRETGRYVAKSIGECEIMVTLANGDVSWSTSCTIKVIPLDIEEVTLNATEKTLYIGEEFTLAVTITPEETAEYATVEWFSPSEDIATVDNNGKVTAISEGTCRIRARVYTSDVSQETEASPSKVVSCQITVLPNDVKAITLDVTEKTLLVGEEFTLTATVWPENATYKDVRWSSSNNDIAEVDSEGNVTALKVGTCRIYAKTKNNISATCVVTVKPVDVEAIVLNVTEKTLLVGEEFALTATISPEDATYQDVEWSSSDPTVATVSDDGKVCAVKEGTCTISAKAGNNQTATCAVTVKSIDVESITLNLDEKTLEEGEEFTLTATVAPENATYKDVEWSSSDPTVATVDDNGKVTAVKAGECLISAKGQNNKEGVCRVVVKPVSVKSVKIIGSAIKLLVGESTVAKYQVTPSNAVITDVKWEIEDESIATVSEDGTVTCNGLGTTKLTVTVNGEHSAECQVKGCTIEDFVSLKFGSSAISSINGYVTGTIGCILMNNSSQEIIAKSIQVIESVSETAGNEMSLEDCVVGAKSSVGYSIQIKVPTYQPIFRWKYTHDGNEYTIDIKYE